MLYSVQQLIAEGNQCQRQMPYGSWVPARPMWSGMGRWKHAWWVLTGRCDAVWWPEDGNPYRRRQDNQMREQWRKGRADSASPVTTEKT